MRIAAVYLLGTNYSIFVISQLYVDKRKYNTDELVQSGRLVFKDDCLQVEGFSSNIDEPAKYYLTIGAEGVKSIELTMPNSKIEISSIRQLIACSVCIVIDDDTVINHARSPTDSMSCLIEEISILPSDLMKLMDTSM